METSHPTRRQNFSENGYWGMKCIQAREFCFLRYQAFFLPFWAGLSVQCTRLVARLAVSTHVALFTHVTQYFYTKLDLCLSVPIPKSVTQGTQQRYLGSLKTFKPHRATSKEQAKRASRSDVLCHGGSCCDLSRQKAFIELVKMIVSY